ncbi:MAG: hypothetical protein LUP94_03825 [Candidatus Methanomethylicus sp.]|nr:hypothetical protein [Candidatus Methanomethylicus sp.]
MRRKVKHICSQCKGSGEISVHTSSGTDAIRTCPRCGGSGFDSEYFVDGPDPDNSGGNYGVENNSNQSYRVIDPCFIATAVYGTPAEPKIDVLRDFRDEFISRNLVGNVLVRFYYWASPPIAIFIANHSILKKFLRKFMIDPLVEAVKDSKHHWKAHQ